MENSSDSLLSRWKWPLIAGGLLLLAMGGLGHRWLNPAYEPPVQPVPNAYNDLVSLGAQLAPRTGFYDEVPEAELAAIVSANTPVLDKAREALRKESMVALDWNADEQWFGGEHLKHIENLRSLSRGFAAEGMHALRQGDARGAVRSGLDNLKLGDTAARGGLGTDWLLGIAIQTVGLMSLRDACEWASLPDCDPVLLSDAGESMEPPAEITKREWHFFRRINGPWTTFIMEMTFANNRSDFETRMEDSLRVLQARARMLRLHYAIRAHKLQNKRLPKSLAEVMGYLTAQNFTDPFRITDFIYQPGKDRYILYSVGPNGVDDGGFVNDKDPALGDLVLEPHAPSDDEPSQD